LTLWAAVALAYAAFWLSLTVYVDARGRSTPAQALTLVALWLATVVLVPGAIDLTARAALPSPPGPQLATAIRAATHAAAAETGRQLGPFLEDHPPSGVGRAGMQQYAAVQEARETAMARRLRPVLAAFEQRRDERRALIARLRYLAPAMLAQFSFADIAGTSEARHREFEQQATRFQQAWKNFFGPRLASAAALDGRDYACMPSFAFREERMSALSSRVALPFVVLLASAAALLAAAFRRYAVAPLE
jgi:ABC-2 type transport system permease protein